MKRTTAFAIAAAVALAAAALAVGLVLRADATFNSGQPSGSRAVLSARDETDIYAMVLVEASGADQPWWPEHRHPILVLRDLSGSCSLLVESTGECPLSRKLTPTVEASIREALARRNLEVFFLDDKESTVATELFKTHKGLEDVEMLSLSETISVSPGVVAVGNEDDYHGSAFLFERRFGFWRLKTAHLTWIR